MPRYQRGPNVLFLYYKFSKCVKNFIYVYAKLFIYMCTKYVFKQVIFMYIIILLYKKKLFFLCTYCIILFVRDTTNTSKE